MPVPRVAAPSLCALLLAMPAVRAASPGEADAVAGTAAQAIRALPCAGEVAKGFTAVDGIPVRWQVAGATVSVRRDAVGDRFAFVLDPQRPGATDCAVRDVLALPRRGEILACTLADDSLQGLGVHALLGGGERRDLVFWRGDGRGGLRRTAPGERDYASDTGELLCAPPGPIGFPPR